MTPSAPAGRYSSLADRPIPYARQNGPAALSPMQVQRVRDYINANLSRDLGLAELAELSPHYFSMLFKSTLGVSPQRYVLGERIREAQRRLAARRMSISQVAWAWAFRARATSRRRSASSPAPRRSGSRAPAESRGPRYLGLKSPSGTV